jgi:hypothetical protein
MVRSILCSLLFLGLCGALVAAPSKETDKSKKEQEAKITKVDAKKGTVTVKMKDEMGKDVEKTFKLAEDIEYLDSTGKVASVDIFTSGDLVLVVEREGKIAKMKKEKSDNTTKPNAK